jgi:hypothetical protein
MDETMTSTENSPADSATSPDAGHLVPPSARERVTIAPPAEWVSIRAVDETPGTAAPGASALLLFDRQHHASLGARYERSVRLLKTVQAVHEAAQWRLDFDPGTQRVAVHSVAIRRADQCIEHAAPERLRLLQREENLERLVIDGRVTVVLLIEDVRVGDIIDASFTVQSQSRILPEHFWTFCVVPTHVPLRAFHLSVRYPNSRALRWKASDDDFAPVFHKHGDESEWHWKLEEVRPRDVEPAVPGWHIGDPWMQVSDCASWDQVAIGFQEAWREELNAPELIEAANQIAAAAATPAERADRALTLVQDDVRYLSLNSGLGGQVPSPPGVVLRRRFGDCKDKSFLAAHLLRRLGIPARPVLINTALRHTIEPLLPMPDAFNHVVVEYEVAGKRRWVDVTLPMQGGGALNRPMPEFRLGLPIGPGVTALDRLASVAGLNDHYELRETFTIDTAGRPSMLKVLVTASGTEAENLRRELAMEGPETVARSREQFYRQFFADLRRVGTLEWRDDRAHNEMRLAELFDIRGVTVPGRDAQTCVFEHRAHLIQAVLGFSETGARKQPFGLRYPCHVHHWIEIESPALSGGPGHTRPGRDLAFRFSCDLNEQYGRIIAHYSLRTLADAVRPDRFEQYKTKVREIWPCTFLHVVLPLGLALPKRNRAAGSLLPAAPPARKNKARNDAAVENPAPSELTLPAEPAPALAPAPGSAVETVAAPAESALPSPKTPAPPKRVANPSSAAAFTDPTSTAIQPRSRRRRRRSRFNWRKAVQIAVFAIIALVVVLVLIMANLRKG